MRLCARNFYRSGRFLFKSHRFLNVAALIPCLLFGYQAEAQSNEIRQQHSHAVTVSTQNVTFPSDANVINAKTQYGAAGDGVTDDTAALQNAISNAGQGQIVYLPSGTYLVSNTLFWKYTWGGWRAWVRLQGQNQANTVIKLKNNTFTNTANCDVTTYHGIMSGVGCQAVLYLTTDYNANYPSTNGAGEDAYMNSVQDLTVDVGSGNPGAIGVDVLISNSGAIRNVTVRSGDGQGRFGIALTRDCCGGPGYLENLTINGFDYGIAAGYSTPQMGYTLEHIALSGQRISGIYDQNFPLWIRDLTSSNSVPVAVNTGLGRLTILDGQFTGGSSAISAVQDNSNGGVVFLRNIATSGYRSARSVNGTMATGASISEYSSHAVQSQFSSVSTSLNLPVKETPTYVNTDFTQWASVQAYGATANGWTDDTAAIQAALNSGKPVVYFPYGKYAVNGTLHIPSSVHLVEGFGSLLQGTITTASARPGTKFSCEATSGGPVILDNFHYDKYTLSNGQITSISNTCTVPFVMRDLFDFVGYLGNTSADVFWEDAAITGAAQHGGHFYGRQVNVEIGVTHLEFDNAIAWVFGYKTEGIGGNGMMWAHNGATVEMLGAFHYPNTTPAGVAYTIQGSNVSLVNVGSYIGFSPAVSETRNTTTLTMNDGSWDWGIGFGLYSASTATYGSDTTPPSVPTSLTASAQSTSQIALSWSASTDNVGVAGYNVYRNGTQIGSTAGLSYTDSGLTASTTYSYSLAAYDAANNTSALSGTVSATTMAPPDTTAPSVPAGLKASAASQSSVTISWNASTDNVGVAGYKVYRNGTQVGSTAGLSYTDSGLSASTAYSYSVAAFDAANNTSAVCAAVSILTQTAAAQTSASQTSGGGGLPSATYTITAGSKAVDGGWGYNGASPAVQFYTTTAGNSYQSWIWNGSTLQNVGWSGHYMTDGGSGTVSESTTADTWVAVSGSGGYTLRNSRTGNYLANSSGNLSMSGTATIWVLTQQSSGGGLSTGTYEITSGNSAADGGWGYNGASPAVQFYTATPSNVYQQWVWNGSTLQNAGWSGHYMTDGGSGTVSESITPDTWTITTVSGGYSIKNTRTGNYLTNSSGTLKMSGTATIWSITKP